MERKKQLMGALCSAATLAQGCVPVFQQYLRVIDPPLLSRAGHLRYITGSVMMSQEVPTGVSAFLEIE